MDQSRTSSTTDPAAAALISLKCLLEQVTSRINALPYTLLCAAALIAAVTVNGLWTTPALDAVWLIAADITQDPFPSTADADWLLSSWLTPALAWLAGATATPRMFALFCGGLLAACYAAMCVMFRFRVGEPTARILVLVLVTSPLATVLLTWIGYGDPLSVTLASAILLLPPLWLRGACAALLAANHAEQAMVLLAVCFLLIPCLESSHAGRAGWRMGLTLLAGGLAGWGGVHFYQAVQGIHIEFNRVDYMLGGGVDRYFTVSARNPQMFLWSFFGLCWLLVVPAAMILRQQAGNAAFVISRIILTTLCCVGATLATLDSTRVFSILSWPLLVTLLVLAVRQGAGPSLNRLAASVFVLGLFLPRVVTWDGQVQGGTAPYTLAWALEASGITPPGILPESRLAPFREAPEHRLKVSVLLPDHGPAPLVEPGRGLSFTNQGGEDLKALRRGWSLPELWGTWSEQSDASLRVRLPPEAALTGVLDAVVTAFLGNSGNPQVVEVSVDGRPVTTWTLTQGEATSHPIPVPKEATRNGDPISIDFHIPTARSPASENVSGDLRQLGFGLVAIRVLNGG
jgi:hypothetical protein